MAVKATLFISAVALLVQNISGRYLEPYYDSVAPWARTFLAWRQANTNVDGYSARLLNAPNAGRYSSPVYDIPYTGAYNPAGLPSYDGLVVSSASNGPIGVSVLSENFIGGPLAVAGKLPFLGTVALDGALPTFGSGDVSYGCGDGRFGPIIYNEFSRPRFIY